MSETTYYQRNKEVMLNTAKEHYQNNKEILGENARNKYRTLSDEPKRGYERNRYRNLSEEDKQRLKEYQRNYRETSR